MEKYASYEGIVESWGYEVIDWETFGDYQGDHLVLLRDGEQWGFVSIGYGSCSGCDALEDVRPWCHHYGEDAKCTCDFSGVQALSDELRDSVRWNTAAGLAEFFTSEVAARQWYSFERGVRPKLEGWAERLRSA